MAFKPQGARTREDEFKRYFRSLLNKVTPTNLTSIVGHLAELRLRDEAEFQQLISTVCVKAYSEPHYCETYADLMLELWHVHRTRPGAGSTFDALLSKELHRDLGASLACSDAASKDRPIATLKFVGLLFLRDLLGVELLSDALHGLLWSSQGTEAKLRPDEWKIECACELLRNVGHTLDTTLAHRSLAALVFDRLFELEHLDRNSGSAFSLRAVFQMRDLRELRANGWNMKVLRLRAKTMEDVRKGFQEEALARKKGECLFERRVAGLKPSLEPKARLQPVDESRAQTNWHLADSPKQPQMDHVAAYIGAYPMSHLHTQVFQMWALPCATAPYVQDSTQYASNVWLPLVLDSSQASFGDLQRDHAKLGCESSAPPPCSAADLKDDDASTFDGGGHSSDGEADAAKQFVAPVDCSFEVAKPVRDIQGSNERLVAKGIMPFGECTFTLLAKRCKKRKGGASFKTSKGVCTAHVRCHLGHNREISVSLQMAEIVVGTQRHNFHSEPVCNFEQELDLKDAIDERSALVNVTFKFESST